MEKTALVLGGTCTCTLVYLSELPEPRTQHLWSKRTHSTIGQMGTGKSLNLSRLGFKTTLQAYIGDDENGRKIRDFFTAEKINFDYDIDPAGTENHINLMDDHGGRISITTNNVTFEPAINLNKMEGLIKAHDYIVLNIYNYCRRLIPLIKMYKKDIWCDLGDYEPGNQYFSDFAEAADYITLSGSNLKDYRGVMRGLMDKGKKLVVCTHGSQGATALTPDGHFIEIPIIDEYELVDSNGAGDSFFAGLLYACARGYAVDKMLKVASVVAGLCITDAELACKNLSPSLVELEYKKHYGDE